MDFFPLILALKLNSAKIIEIGSIAKISSAIFFPIFYVCCCYGRAALP